ncbi:hypothetical protein V7056_10825 [Bacillus sp. JJ664]
MKNVLSLKGKIAAGIAAATILGSTGVAFANTNAGVQFKAWGDAKITAAMDAVKAALAGEIPNAQASINSKANTDRDAAKGRIDAAGVAEKSDTKSKIEAKLAEHISSLQNALAAFMSSIGGDFDSLVNAEKGNTTSTLNDQYSGLQTNITSVLNNAKAANVKDVTDSSLLVKGKATSDLIKEINRVKSELAAEVESQKNTATSEVLAHLTSEVARINGQLDTLIAGLESSAKTAIEEAGQSVEDSAIANFDRVINLIQTETPIKVDEQKLSWEAGRYNDNKIKFKVKNSNEFDVVFRYHFETPNHNTGGVSETPFAQSVASPGVKEFTFDVSKFVGVDLGGLLVVEYLDEDGNYKHAYSVKLLDLPNL